MSSGHICDTRCLGESGHHSWPSPREDECLCSQFLKGEKVYCPMHDNKKTEVEQEPNEAIVSEKFKKVLSSREFKELILVLKRGTTFRYPRM